MKTLLTTILSITIFTSYAQEPSEAFDFWVGEWEVKWQGGHGTNTITKTLDGKVIQENFQILEGQNVGFKGTSISVFNPRNESWHQAWADNNGGYYNFIGDITDNQRIFKTMPIERDDKIIIQRMVFKDIKTDNFTWDWEGTQDGGKTWNLLWRIEYSRK